MKVTINEAKKTLTVELPIEESVSSSGKSTVIASTRGNKTFADVIYKGKPLTVGLNAFVPVG